MKRNSLRFAFLAAPALLCISVAGFAEDVSMPESVMLKAGAMLVTQNGTAHLMTNEVKLSHEIKVMTNSTFRVRNGKERQLVEGQTLGADGMLTSSDGSEKPVYDHIALLKGKLLLMKDGDVSALENAVDVPEVGRVTPEGDIFPIAGSRRKLLDGEIIDLAGNLVASSDTVTLKDGKVFVQKDGSLMEVSPGRSLMMNDGSKVFGDGTVLMKDGTKKSLSAGEILKLEGVALRSP